MGQRELVELVGIHYTVLSKIELTVTGLPEFVQRVKAGHFDR